MDFLGLLTEENLNKSLSTQLYQYNGAMNKASLCHQPTQWDVRDNEAPVYKSRGYGVRYTSKRGRSDMVVVTRYYLSLAHYNY